MVKICLHKYEDVGTQTVPNVLFGFGEVSIMRQVKKCKKCGKVKYVPLTLGINMNDYEWK